MLMAMATANFYRIPFERALSLIRRAGFSHIELDGYWIGGDNWECAQHIKSIPPRDVLQMVFDHGLHIASYHDMGGVIEDGNPSVVSRSTLEFLELYDFPCIVLHTPHRKATDPDWWQRYHRTAQADLRAIARGRLVCLENMKPFHGYMVPLLSPLELRDFVLETGIHATLDTTHCADCGGNIVRAAQELGDCLKTIHLSDHAPGQYHAFPGDGVLDFRTFYRSVNSGVYLTTLECAIPHLLDDEERAAEACRLAMERTQSYLRDAEHSG